MKFDTTRRMLRGLSWTLSYLSLAVALGLGSGWLEMPEARAQVARPAPKSAEDSGDQSRQAQSTGAPTLPPDFVGPPARAEGDAEQPAIAIGRRVIAGSKRCSSAPTLVIVRDEASYLAALAGWKVDGEGVLRQYPVLIDDGTYASEQRIARFVRAFAPKSVVEFATTAPDAWPAPAKGIERRAVLDRALASCWGAIAAPGADGALPADSKPAEAMPGDAKAGEQDAPKVQLAPGQLERDALKSRWKSLGHDPVGVVATWPTDPSWTAGLALAIGRGQPIIWLEPREGGVGGLLSVSDADTINQQVYRGITDTGFTRDAGFEGIQCMTLCLNMPVKVLLPEGDKRGLLALTDWVGRFASKGKAGAERWGIAGQVFGTASESAYIAMCSLFLPFPERPWLFDGYNSVKPWSGFDMTLSARYFEQAKIDVLLDDANDGKGLDDLRRRASGTRSSSGQGASGGAGGTEAGLGMDVGLVCFNTSGNADFFELKPGIAKPVDIPMMRRPCAVHFVHSWSANNPASRSTVAGMWLERGAYAYIGSVHEPFLAAFVPSPIFVRRLLADFPWGYVGRIDSGEPWKIAVIGDPLLTKGADPAKTSTTTLDLAGTRSLSDALPTLLRAKDYAKALRTLGMLGRDKDAARLLALLLRDHAAQVTPEVAISGIGSAYAMGDLETLLKTARVLIPTLENPPVVENERLAEVRDMVWHATWGVQSTLREDEAELLTKMLRPENLVRDADEAARAIERFGGKLGTRRDVVDRAKGLTKDPQTIGELMKIAR